MAGPADAALEAAARVRVTVVVGAADTGKTYLTTRLASALAAGGARVAAVDADVGQSEIGPPTTVGLGVVTAPLARLREARTLALEFVGDTSPVREIARTADATGRLVRRALAAGFAHVIVDTGGLVQGALGAALKRAKVRATDADLVLVVERGNEGEPLVRALATGERPAVLRVPASPAAARRTAAQRRLHREDALARYMTEAKTVSVPLERLHWRRARDAEEAALVEGRLVGLEAADGETLGIGRVRSVDAAGARVVIDTPVDVARIDRVIVGRAVWREGV